MSNWLGSSWETVAWVTLSTTAIYCSTLVGVRIAGRRTLAQMSAFDFIVTIALGTIVASTALASDPSVAQGVSALVTLLLLQVAVAFARQRSPKLRRALDFSPAVVVRAGETNVSQSPLGAQLTREELLSKMRQQGVFDFTQVELAILEPTGELTLVLDPEAGDKEAIAAVVRDLNRRVQRR